MNSDCNHEVGHIERDKVYANLFEMAVYMELQAEALLSAEDDEEARVVKYSYCPHCGEEIDWGRCEEKGCDHVIAPIGSGTLGFYHLSHVTNRTMTRSDLSNAPYRFPHCPLCGEENNWNLILGYLTLNRN